MKDAWTSKNIKVEDCVERVPPKADYFSQEDEEASEAKRTNFHGSSVSTKEG